MFLGREPVMWMGAVQAAIGALVAFNVVDLTGEQTGAVMLVAASVLSLITRKLVTPVKPG